MNAKPFTLPSDDALLQQIKNKVAAYEWHDMPTIAEGGDRWIYGTDETYMKELCDYWLNHYDWHKTLAELNRFEHFTAPLDGLDIHFIHAKADKASKAQKPLLLTHGWPGSVLEFIKVIEPLRAAGFDVVAPSLPGYAWSAKPKAPIGPATTAALWDRLMREALGYDSYIAQGGDWGSVVSGYLGLNHSKAAGGGGCAAIHLNMYGLRTPEAQAETDEEKAWEGQAQIMMELESAYLRLQMTKPQTLSYAMMDSPVGVCAWIVEKFHRWSDKRGAKPNDSIENAFSKDQLLSNVMIYLMTKTFGTSTWFYRGALEEGMATMPPNKKVDVPTGIALFPAEFIPFPPRRMVEVGYNVTHWQAYDKGGHFAAMEQPELFTREVLDFSNKI